MKKFFLTTLALSFILVLTSCDSGQPESTSSPSEGSQNTATSEATVEAEEATEATSQVTTEVEGKILENTMFDVILSSEWIENVDSRYEGEDYTNISLEVQDGEDARIIAEINLETEDVLGFRSSVEALGIDLYDYAVNGVGERINIAGYDCVVAMGNYWGEDVLSYVGRDEASGTTLSIDISGDYEDPLVETLLSTISSKVQGKGLVDFPYFWEGERISLVDTSANVGSFTIGGTNLSLEEAVQCDDIFSVRMAIDADLDVWLGYDNMLYEYTLSEGLSGATPFMLEDTFTEVSSDENGTIFVSDFGSNLVRINTDYSTVTYSTVTDYLQIHPSGTWGLTYFVGSIPERIDFNGDTAEIVPYYSEGELFEADEVRFTKNHIALIGNEIGGEIQKIMILDQDKNPLFVLGGDDFSDDDDYLAAVTDIVETDNGFIAVDGNLRTFLFWDKSGNFIASLSDGDLLGSSYPWISDMQLMPDGSILVAFSEEREDRSGYEVLVSRLTGF